MKVLHVIPSISPKRGGPSFAVDAIARSVARRGITVDLASTDDDGDGLRSNLPLATRLERDGYSLYLFRKNLEFYTCSHSMAHWLRRQVKEYDLVHVHALFSFSSTVAAFCSARNGIPYVVRPLGVLNSWGMRNRRRLLKALSGRLVEARIVRHAAAIHFTSDRERCEAERAGFSGPSAVIPLGLTAPEAFATARKDLFLKRFPELAGKRVVLFLSRLHPIKGLDLLLPAFAEARKACPDLRLVLAGDGKGPFVSELRALAARLGISDAVIWRGFLDGEEKLSAMAAAAIYVLPSYSESFGIALLEALCAGLPCVVTTGVALSEEVQRHVAGLVAAPNPREISAAIIRLAGSAELRQQLADNGRRLASERFSMGTMGAALETLYHSVLDGSVPQPTRELATGHARELI